MSSNLQSLQSLNTTSRARNGGNGDLGSVNPSDLLGHAGGGAERASFGKWMTQLQDARAKVAQSPVLPPAAQAGTPLAPAARQPAPASAAQTQAKRPSADKAEQAAAERQKAAQKAAQPKQAAPSKPASPPDAAKASEGTAEEGERAVSESASEDEGREVRFATGQGEGAAWVRELQPPSDLPTSDPSAMLAWLSSLTQGDGAAATLPQDGAGTPANAPPATGHDAPRGLSAELRGLPPTATAALEVGAEQAGEAAKAVDDMAAVSGQSAETIDFSALLAREVGRPAGGVKGGEAAHQTATLSAPVDSPDFQDALAERVGLWVSGAVQNGPMTAELRLNPEDMGPIHVRIVLDGQAAQVDFAAAHAETRQAIEASLPALSGKLEEAGLSLSGGGVSDQPGREAWAGAPGEGSGSGSRWGTPPGDDGQNGAGEREAAAPGAAARPLPASRRPGGLDLYA